MKHLLSFLATILLFLLITPAFSEELLEEIVVTASRIEEPLQDVSSSVTVITSEDIKKMNVRDISDVFRTIPEVNLVQNGGPGKEASMILRGGDSRHVLVLIDGIRVNSPATSSFDFSGILLEDIERIEIIKGPQSTIYGSEAMAGVVNIITKRPRRSGLELSFEGGSHGTYSPSFSVYSGSEGHSLRISASYLKTDGISAAKSGDEKDGYENSTLSGSLTIKPASWLELQLSSRFYQDSTELDGFDFMTYRAADDLNYNQRGDHLLNALTLKAYPYERWEQILRLSMVEDKISGSDPDTAFNNYMIKTEKKEINWQHNILFGDLTLTAGVEYRKEDALNQGNFDKSRESHAYYLNNRVILLKDLIFNAGIRYDHYELSGSRTTYRVGALYNLRNAGLRIRSNYGTGFRAPSMNELYFPFFGNPDLKPEKSYAWDAGMDKDLFSERLTLTVTYFREKYKDLINYDSGLPKNISRADVKGIETGLKIKVSQVIDFRAGYVNLDTEDRGTGQRLSRRPEHRANMQLNVVKGDFSGTVYYIYTGGRYDAAIKENLPPYSIVNLSADYKFSRHLTTFMRIENLFDKDYEEAGGYGRPGFSAYGGIRWML